MSVLFIFRRDLRWSDNIGLTRAFEYAKANHLELRPIFIFNELQINPKKNPYFGLNTVRFMIQCLDRDLSLNIDFYHTRKSDISVIDKLNPKAVFFNRDFTPFARKRDDEIIEYCHKNNIYVYGEWSEYSIINIPEMPKPYRVYSAFLKVYKHQSYETPINNEKQILTYIAKHRTKKLHRDPQCQNIHEYYNHKSNNEIAFEGGRAKGIERLESIKEGTHDAYERNRNYPEYNTTHLSAYLKYGCISIREAYHTIKSRKAKGDKIINELFWRAYYDQLAYYFPHVLEGQIEKSRYNKSLNPKNDKTIWTANKHLVKAITTGQTNIPIVDAAVQQLIRSGYMHNRLRMIVCMVASRICKLDWRIFERWFAQHLIDYYPTANNGGWQWSVQYRFVLNPWVQQEKFDKNTVYIKRWLSTLENIDAKDIHTWYIKHPSIIKRHI